MHAKMKIFWIRYKNFLKNLQSLALVTLIDLRKFQLDWIFLTNSKNGSNLFQWVSLGRSRRVKFVEIFKEVEMSFAESKP